MYVCVCMYNVNFSSVCGCWMYAYLGSTGWREVSVQAFVLNELFCFEIKLKLPKGSYLTDS